jgi:S1-C subfamily serine protease
MTQAMEERATWSRLVKFFAAGAVVLTLLAASASAVYAAPSGATTSTRGSATAGVVVVRTRLAYGGGAGAATGMVLTSSGTVLTNNHVIRGAGSITVTVPSTGRSYTASVVGYSVSKDVALLRLRNAQGLQTVQTGNSNAVHVGDSVTAVGNAGGSGVLTVKTGKVTGLGQSITVSDDGGPVRMTGLIETTASLRPGDSGGPLLSGGRVVGIDAARTASFYYEDSNQGYAIPINRALAIARQIQSGRGSSTVHVGPTAFLGVGIGPSNGGSGALVEHVASGSPAAKAGIGENDIITAFAGKRVSSPTRLRQLVLHSSPGRAVRITWIDAYEGTTNATVRLVAGPPQ